MTNRQARLIAEPLVIAAGALLWSIRAEDLAVWTGVLLILFGIVAFVRDYLGSFDE